MRLQNSSGGTQTPTDLYQMYTLEAGDDTSATAAKTTATAPTAQVFDYVTDGKYSYTPAEAALKISQMTGKTVTEADIKAKLGGKTALNDQDLFRLFDINRDGKADMHELNQFAMNGSASGAFNYLKDATGSYSAADTAKMISDKTGVLVSEAQIKSLFGKDTITDSDLMRVMDGSTMRNGGMKDAMIGKSEVLKMIYGAIDTPPQSPFPGMMTPGGGMPFPGMMNQGGGMPFPGMMNQGGGMPFPGMMNQGGGMPFPGMMTPGGGMPFPGMMAAPGGMPNMPAMFFNPFFAKDPEIAVDSMKPAGGIDEGDSIRDAQSPFGFTVYIAPAQSYPGYFGSAGMRGVTNGNIQTMIDE